MNEPKPFVLGVDLDGVCGDYNQAFREVLAQERGIATNDLPVARTWDFDEWDLDADAFLAVHERAVLEHRMFATMPAVEGVSDALWRLSDAGVWIRIVTHRLCQNWSHAVTVSDTVSWLDHHKIPYRDLCFLGDKPEVGADAYIDDAPHNIAALRSAGATAIVFGQPYNLDVEGPRAESWAEVETLVHELMAAQDRPITMPLPGLEANGDRLVTRLR